MSSSHFFIVGQLIFSPRKITLESGGTSYFVRTRSLGDSYIHGDTVRARVMKRSDMSRLAEVDILSLVRRTENILLGEFIFKKNKIFLEVLPEQGKYEKQYATLPSGYELGDIVSFTVNQSGGLNIFDKFSGKSDFDREERILFYLSGVRTDFEKVVIEEGEKLEKLHTLSKNQNGGDSHTPRTDFRDWFTLTIDGADAKDLDDAISIRMNAEGNYVFAVHIADVAEYVREGSNLDREAYLRATSIYTPGKVIPMLPESLSNNLCSLQPDTPKLTLSCVMEVDTSGHVRHTDIVEGIIQSSHRGIYENIQKLHDTSVAGKQDATDLDSAISLGYKLYSILQKRRQKEGKILFESTELYFDFEKREEDSLAIPTHIHKRVRTDAHKLIEEFMILANEEVAKWCERHGVPFLSRVHSLPGYEQIQLIQAIIGFSQGLNPNNEIILKKPQKTITPSFIRLFLDTITDDNELYRLSRLLLPKMAKAQYADKRFMHFGLALEYYAHFTSPIRRYPDLQIHRIIKEKIHGTLTPEKIAHYKNILKKVARHCSLREKSAEDIERVFDALYACRYMQDAVGKSFLGRVSGVTDFAVFIELDNGVEGTLYLPRQKFIVNPVEGTLENTTGKVLYRIGDELSVTIDRIDMNERRIILDKGV